MVEGVRRHAAKTFVLNPDLLPFAPDSEFLPYAFSGLGPRRLDVARPAESSRVVHAPTDRGIKGTPFVEAAADAIQAAGGELDLVEGVPRDAALERYARAGVVVDQLRIGWYGVLAVEAMALGLPVVAYLEPEQLARIPDCMREEIPLVHAHPEELPSVLAALLADPARRSELGRCGRAFVARWHHPVRIARRMLDLYRDPDLAFWDGYDPDAPVPDPT